MYLRVRIIVAVGLVATHAIPAQTPSIVVSPRSPVVQGDDVSLRLERLTPGSEYQLVASIVNEWGATYRSSNIFVATSSGIIDLTRDAPVRGSYTGADRLAVFWSATRQGAAPAVGPADAPADSVVVSLSLRQEGRTVDSTRLVQWLRRPGTTVREIREGGIVAALYQPADSARHPLVVVIGGSGGGMTWQRQTAALLSSHGYAALALAYFGLPGLPASFSEIPLEYFRDAASLATRMARIDTTRIGVIGLSFGGETALLIASHFPQFSAVVAYAPSHTLFMGQRPPEFLPITPFTLGGKPLAYVPTQEVRAYRDTDNQSDRHMRYLGLHAAAAADAVIRVENIHGPVLLFAGGVDPVWPSAFMTEMITERLAQKNFKYAVSRFAYDSAGHAFARPGYQSTAPAGFSGGDPRANAYAQADSWRRTLEFLAAWRGRTP